MIDVLSVGSIEVEIMRPKPDLPLDEIHLFVGPFPSWASVITVGTAAKLGLESAIVGTIGNDEFGNNVYNKLIKDGVNVNEIKIDSKATTGVAFVSYTSQGGRNYIFYIDPKTDNISENQFKFKKWGKIKLLHLNGSSIVSSELIRKVVIMQLKK